MKIAIVDSGLGLVSLLKMIVNFRLKHDIDLIFSKNFPLGNCSLSELEETAKDIEDRINKKNYDKMKKALNAAGFFLDVENGVLKLQISQYGYERKQKRNAGRKKKCALKKENGEYTRAR